MIETELNKLSEKVIGCAIEVHRHLGPGLLESAYHKCLCKELELAGLQYASEVDIPISYKGLQLDCGYRADIIVEEAIILELKSVSRFEDVHMAQALSYLKLTNLPLGLLINFNVQLLKDGIKRIRQ